MADILSFAGSFRSDMRKVGRLVARQAQVNLALARGEDNYPVSRTGTLVSSIAFKLSRSGFLVKIAPYKTCVEFWRLPLRRRWLRGEGIRG